MDKTVKGNPMPLIRASDDDELLPEFSPEPEDSDDAPFRNSDRDGVMNAHTSKDEQLADKATPPPEQNDDRPATAGRLTQWAYHGAGYVATTRTTAIVPTGTYKIDYDQRAGFHLQPLPIMTDNLYRLPDTKSDEVIEEIRRFWTINHLFKKWGFVHKRGFLLWGPPGSGKTSTIAMATRQMLEMDGLVIFGDNPQGMGSVLYQIRQVEPHRPIIVIVEDIDTVIHRHGEAEVLAILDGEQSIDNVVFLATTNYPEKLDGRVVNRPSRFDKVVKIGMPSPEARALYLSKKGIPEAEVQQWVDLSEGFSIAHLKELIVCVMCFGDKLEEVSARLHKMMAKAPKSEGGDKPVGFGK